MSNIKEMYDVLENIMAIDSPIGYTKKAEDYVFNYLTELGYEPQRCKVGGVYCTISEGDGENLILTAHMDTLGAMVKEINGCGRLNITPLGALNANNVECENCKVYTRDGRVYTGTVQLKNASTHVNKSYDETKRSFDSVEVVLDYVVNSKEDVQSMGIDVGDIVAVDPRLVITETGYIKSRFLDDKAGAAVLLYLAKQMKSLKTDKTISLHFSANEEMGFGASALVNKNADTLLAIDMGCVGDGLNGSEQKVSICAKDSCAPYNYEMVSKLISICKEENIDYAVDIYPAYGSDAEAAIRAGLDTRFALIGMGVYASHGYERTHKDGMEGTFKLIKAYIEE